MKTYINSEVSLYTVQHFLNEIKDKLVADLAFQASDLTRWSDSKATGYITSVIRGMAPSPFILADVNQCLDHAVTNHRVIDIEYYQQWKDKNIQYLNIDSNNRTINIQRFIDNEIPISSGDYVVDGSIYQVVRGMNDTFSELPPQLQQFFLQRTLSVVIYTNPTRQELSDIFVNINDGQPLNHPEKRNAITSNIASTIRELASKYREEFYEPGYHTVWFNESTVIRRGIDDFIAGMMAYYFTNNLTISYNNAKLWEMYKPGSTADMGAKNFEDEFNRFMRFFRPVPEFYMIPNRNSIFDLWVIWCQAKQQNKEFTEDTRSSFMSSYINVLKDLLSNGKDYKFDGPDTIKGYTGTKPFDTLVAGRQSSNNIMRNKLILQGLNIDDYIIEKDKRRTGTKTDKFVLAVDSGMKTYEGKDINPKKLHTSKYHMGHKKAHSKGGKTTRENLVIQTSEDNLKTGTKDLD